MSKPTAPTFVEIPQPPGIIANDIAALRVSTPSFTGDLAAVARVACAPGTAGGLVDMALHRRH